MKQKDRQSSGKLSKTEVGNETASARGSARSAERAAGNRVGAEPDATPSNTASYNCNPEYFKLLRFGVDSLYLSYPGEIFPEVDTRLKAMKLLAQSADKAEQ